MKKYTTKALTTKTWPDFARLVDANGGVWGGCWCTWYHSEKDLSDEAPKVKCKKKEQLVKDGKAHAALVFDGDDCVGWCQFGSPEELPRIHNQKAYLATDSKLPNWKAQMGGYPHRQS